MNFFGHQEEARRATIVLVALFGAAITCLTGLLYTFCLFLFDYIGYGPRTGWWREDIALSVGIGTVLVVGCGSIYKILQLRGGGAAVAQSLGGRPLNASSTDASTSDASPTDHAEKQLLNIVEEMAIASGVPVPQVWVLEQNGINAFAAGYSPSDAVIGVTRGCMEQLDRDELQGVIAHEFSHILNGDMRLNIRLMGVLHGLVCLSIAGTICLRGSFVRGSRRTSGPAIGLGLALLITGALGVLFARLIKAAVSRQREFLADASAVQFTRNPNGIANALKRIGGMLPPRASEKIPGSTIDHPRSEEASHMFFSSAMRRSMAGWFSTHPPLLERILKIEPRYTGSRAEATMESSQSASPQGAMGFASQSYEPSVQASAEALVNSVGSMNQTQLGYGAQLLRELPMALRAAAHDPFSARAVIYALLLAPSPTTRRTQLQGIADRADPATLQETLSLSSLTLELDTAARLPLVDLTMPALRNLSQEQFAQFTDHVSCLIDTDEPSLFAFCVTKALVRHLRESFGDTRKRSSRIRPEALHTECRTVLNCLAHAGHSDREAAKRAYADGLSVLKLDETAHALKAAPDSIRSLGHALDQIAMSTSYGKRSILIACARAAASDGIIEVAEMELLRAVADTLDCPMPPLVQATVG